MEKLRCRMVCLSAFLFLLTVAESRAQEGKLVADTICREVVYFKFNSSVVDSGYVSNGNALKSLERVLGNPAEKECPDSIRITATASPDGVYEHNIRLALKRARALKGYLVWKYPHLDQHTITIHNGGENWQGLMDSVRNDRNVPYREKVMTIIGQDVNPGTKKWRLQQVGGGTAWRYIAGCMLRYLRAGSTDIVVWGRKTEENPEVPEKPRPEVAVAEPAPDKAVTDTATVSDTTPKAAEATGDTVSVTKEEHPLLALKTNLAAYIVGVANAAVEVPLTRNLSVDIPVYYSPYTLADNYKFRILGFEPEVKYWFGKALSGHAIGLHGIGVMYNVAFNSRDRFQNKDGEKFAFGAGLSYAYSLKLKKNWRLELTAGVGYVHLDHDVFRNVENGALYDNRKLHYWGPTKVGIHLVYLFNKR